MTWLKPRLLITATAGLAAGCAVGPDYEKPPAPVPATFKEVQGWKPATPQDAVDKGAWWSIYHDPVLDGLEAQIDVSNQTLKQAEAQFRQAAALVSQSEASLFPTVSANAQATRSHEGSGAVGSSGSSSSGSTSGFSGRSETKNQYQVGASASWDIDLWGKIRRTIEQNMATAEASAGDVANARLSAQAQLATAYFQLRQADSQRRLLEDTVTAYSRNVEITRNRYNAGTAAKSDLAQAQTQLETTRAQAINTGAARTQNEHAIAVLVGKPPADLTIDVAPLAKSFPMVPAGVPSTLLERRPDIATAERQMAAANAGVGVAIAAYYPDLTLTGSYGVQGTKVGSLFQGPQTVWSLGGSLAETIFDAGARDAQVLQARAAWDASVANYRQTVLTAFQGVEDQLSALHVLEDQADVLDRAVADAHEAEALILNEYKAGTVDFTTVITAQAATLQNELSALQVRGSRAAASVALVKAVGGGWTVQDLPKEDGIGDLATASTSP